MKKLKKFQSSINNESDVEEEEEESKKTDSDANSSKKTDKSLYTPLLTDHSQESKQEKNQQQNNLDSYYKTQQKNIEKNYINSKNINITNTTSSSSDNSNLNLSKTRFSSNKRQCKQYNNLNFMTQQQLQQSKNNTQNGNNINERHNNQIKKIFFAENSKQVHDLCPNKNSQGNFEIQSEKQKQFCLIQLLQKIEPIRSENVKMISWELLVSLIIIVVFFIIPIKISFHIDYINKNADEIGVPGYTIDYISGGIFIILTFDIFLRFFRCYYELGIAITDRKKIINHYLTGLFISDIIVWVCYILDFTFLGKIFPQISLVFYLKIINLSKFNTKIIRILQLHRKLKGLYLLLKLVLFILFVCHVAACVFYSIHDVVSRNDPSEQTWVKAINEENGNDLNLLEQNWLIKYSFSLYWSIQTMVTVGYGDVTPRNNYEIPYTSMTMIGSCLIFAYSVNSIYQIFNDIKQGDVRYERNFNAIGRFMRDKNVKQNMQLQVGAFLEFNNKERNREKDIEDQVIQSLPPILRQKLIYRAYGKHFFGTIPWMKKPKSHLVTQNLQDKKQLYIFSKPFLEELSFHIQEEHFTKDEVVFYEKEQLFDEDYQESHQLYFVQKGSFQEFINLPIYNNQNGIELKKFYKNSHFGDFSFLTGNPRPFSVKSIDYSTVYKISRKKFLEVLNDFPQDKEKYCALKDKLIFQQKYSNINWKCYFCNNNDHISNNCYKMHYSVDPEKLVKFNNLQQEERNTNYYRIGNIKYDFRTNVRLIQEAAIKIQQILVVDTEEEFESDFDEDTVYDDDFYTQSDYEEEEEYSQSNSNNLITEEENENQQQQQENLNNSLQSPNTKVNKKKRMKKKSSDEIFIQEENSSQEKQGRRMSRTQSINNKRKISGLQESDRADIIKKYNEKQQKQQQNQQQQLLQKNQFSLIEEDELEHLQEKSSIINNQQKIKHISRQRSSNNQYLITKNSNEQNELVEEYQNNINNIRQRNKTVSIQSFNNRENSNSNININQQQQPQRKKSSIRQYAHQLSQNSQANDIQLQSNINNNNNIQAIAQTLLQVINNQNNSNPKLQKRKSSNEYNQNQSQINNLDEVGDKCINDGSMIIKEKESFDIDKIQNFQSYMKDFNPKNVLKKRIIENKKKRQQIYQQLDQSNITQKGVQIQLYNDNNGKQYSYRKSLLYNSNNNYTQQSLQGRQSYQNVKSKFY